MKCPECIKEQKKSKVFPGGSSVTLMYCYPFYDEEGRYHLHDSNTTTTQYSCSQGHHWVERYKGSCWCGWQGDKPNEEVIQNKPRLLDLFCGAGGAAMGYARAGFEVVGVDIKPQPHYPFEFHQADALTYPLEGFDAYHASPKCELFSRCVHPNKQSKTIRAKNPDQITPIRIKLSELGKPFVIENVPGAPLTNYIKLDGTMFGLTTIKERWFECHGFEIPLLRTPPFNADGLVKDGKFAGIMRHGKNSGELTKREHLAIAYRIDWGMNREELRETIPPAYTEFIGKYLMAEIALRGELLK